MSLGFFIFWLAASVAAAVYADRQGRNGFGFFWLAVFLSPIVAFLFAMGTPDKAELAKRALKAGDRKCPFCAELVKREAVKCRHCGSDLTKAVDSRDGAAAEYAHEARRALDASRNASLRR